MSHINSGYVGVDKRSSKGGVYGLRKHRQERCLGNLKSVIHTSKSKEQRIEDGEIGGEVPWLWLDANKINGNNTSGNPSDGGAVSSWTSRSGSRVANQSSASVQPDWEENELNSLPVVDFTQSEFMLLPNEEWTADNLSVFLVIKHAGTYGFISRWAHSSSARQWQIRDDILYASDNGTSTRTGLSYTLDHSSFHIDSFIKNGTSYAMQRDLSSYASNTEANTATLHDSTQYTVIGGQVTTTSGTTASYGAGGKLAELLIWDNNLSDADRDVVESYLSEKYNIS